MADGLYAARFNWHRGLMQGSGVQVLIWLTNNSRDWIGLRLRSEMTRMESIFPI